MRFESLDFQFIPLTEEFSDFFFSLDSDPEVLKYYRRGPAKNLQESLINLKAYTDYATLHSNLGAWVVIQKTNHELIGLGVVIHLDKNPENQELEIGYRLPVKNWGKGYATKIAKALIEYASINFPDREILATTHPENVASQHVLLKAGFTHTGEGIFHGGLNKTFKKLPSHNGDK